VAWVGILTIPTVGRSTDSTVRQPPVGVPLQTGRRLSTTCYAPYDHTTVPCHKLLAVKRRPRRLLSDSCEEQTEQLGMTLVRAAVLLVCPTQYTRGQRT
jgi:hypothetical protein